MIQEDRDRWLDQATGGLPKTLAASLRAELAAHFEDAVESFVQQGMPQAEASRRALAALGDPHPVARGFKEVHLGRRQYKAALFVTVLLLVEAFGFSGIYRALNLVDYSTPSRIFYVIDHTVFTALMAFIVVTFRRLMMWHFGSQGADVPGKIILGGAGMYLAANVILELIIDSWKPVPLAFEASNGFEGVCLFIMHGGLLVVWGGMFLLGVRALPTRHALLRSTAILGIILSVLSILALALLYLGSGWSYVAGETGLLVTLFFWPMVGLLFFQVSYTGHRLPVRTA